MKTKKRKSKDTGLLIDKIKERIRSARNFAFGFCDLVGSKMPSCLKRSTSKDILINKGFIKLQKELDVMTYLRHNRMADSLAHIALSPF